MSLKTRVMGVNGREEEMSDCPPLLSAEVGECTKAGVVREPFMSRSSLLLSSSDESFLVPFPGITGITTLLASTRLELMALRLSSA
jgi:hypothetical protein